jgi:hypothetical protein
MTTVAREIQIDTMSDIEIDEAVATGIIRARDRLGGARSMRIRQTLIDAPRGHLGDNTLRLLITFVLDD